MNDTVNAPDSEASGASAPDAASAAPAVAANAAAASPEGARADAPAGRRPGRRGGRNRRRGAPEGAGGDAAAAPEAASTPAPAQGGRRTPHPALEQLAQLYPHLFGAQFLPLKRGIFQDLQDAHPGVFERDALKVALGLHTRSTRYLQVVAEGRPRHDLGGQAVEAMAPEHVYHALTEVYRRRKPRDGEDLRAKLRRRIAQAFEASGLDRAGYDALVRGRDEKANAVLDEALAEVAERDARAEALLRAFEASGSADVAQFADMYGMDVRAAERSLQRGRQLRSAARARAAAAETAAADATESGDGERGGEDAGTPTDDAK
ncbi:ProQ/FINO family protein [Paracidovorax citrulli]|uniref:ProQ/FINO family protein n=1 Tax=Paracidovorax citrulli TaxID=80869 RepID=UPI0005FAAEC5|nr:ProQ/FINO family protein [Paracidovorax citrulli]QCX10926.1 RNA chaperone ProQ [Paracidovorax citrulli]UEG46102.1 ProQ/FINO family protein [Paracidovorax citrulli]UMT86606.1 Fertility inhibition FinO [Paracidovorax citrulli]UMT94648.1 Fertility inhibition FinO [Paracidovorax citrulli]WIY34558.1 ProQ/FINO family protein [Paracidovorax citrulli]